nr:MAG TPA: hypothetical protein [Caudoviricetes sp.]
MRVISQHGNVNLPYEQIVVCHAMESVIALHNGDKYVLGKYSSKEKAYKAMEMLEKHHRLDLATDLISERVKKFFANARRTESNAEIMADISEALTKYEYFQFPQDDEIEV